jgi:hypothetical protein
MSYENKTPGIASARFSALRALAFKALGPPSYPPTHDPDSWLKLFNRVDSLGLPERLASTLKAVCEAACLAAGIAVYAGDFSHGRGPEEDYSIQLQADDAQLGLAFSNAKSTFSAVEAELIKAHLSLPVDHPLEYAGVSSCAHAVALRYIELIQTGARKATEAIREMVWDQQLANEIFGSQFQVPEIDAVRAADLMVQGAVEAGREQSGKPNGASDTDGGSPFVGGSDQSKDAEYGQNKIPVAANRAHSQYDEALKHADEQGITLNTDGEFYEYFDKNLRRDSDEPLPDEETWKRHLRVYRHATHTQKNHRRYERNGRSIVKSEDIDRSPKNEFLE